MYKDEVSAVIEGRSKAPASGQAGQGSPESGPDARQALLDQARALLQLLEPLPGADGRTEGKAPALAALRDQLASLASRFREEEAALAASWSLLRQQLACSQRPWRQSQKRLLRLAGGLLALAPRIDAVLARTARSSEALARLTADIARNERHFTRNVASLALLRQQWEEAKDLLQEGHQAMQKALAGHEPGSYARRQALEESRLVLAPLAEVVRARRARLEIGRSRQRALSERIENFKDSLARETAAQHASGQLCRRLSKALSLLEQRLEMEQRVVVAEGSRNLGLGQDQRKASREGRLRVARLGRDLEAAEALGQLLESSRQTLAEQLRRFTEAPRPPAATGLEDTGPVEALGSQISLLHEHLSGEDPADNGLRQAWLEPSGWIATSLGYRGEDPAGAEAEHLEALVAKVEEQDRLLEEYRERMEEARIEVDGAVQALESLQSQVEEKDRQLSAQRWQLREAERAASDHAAQVARLALAREHAERQAQKVRETLSYQLGYLLNHGFKSWSALLALPGGLAALRREARRRREAKADREDK